MHKNPVLPLPHLEEIPKGIMSRKVSHALLSEAHRPLEICQSLVMSLFCAVSGDGAGTEDC